jgi:1-acyl-sn-glycerol-3-phosphate acyltransferase
MNLLKASRILPMLPAVALQTQLNAKKSAQENYDKTQKWSLAAIQKLGYQFEVKGAEKTKNLKNTLLICNHQGTLDPALIVGTCKTNMAFISKKENETIPILGKMSQNIGSIHFDRESREGNIHMLRSSIKYLKTGGALLIFPEGTRSLSDTMNEFKRGALKPAYMAKSTILPVVIRNSYCLDVKHAGNTLSIEYLDPIPFEDYKDIKEEILSNNLHDLIQQKVLNQS